MNTTEQTKERPMNKRNTKTYTGQQVLELLEAVLTGPCAARCMDDDDDMLAVLEEMRNALKSAK